MSINCVLFWPKSTMHIFTTGTQRVLIKNVVNPLVDLVNQIVFFDKFPKVLNLSRPFSIVLNYTYPKQIK